MGILKGDYVGFVVTETIYSMCNGSKINCNQLLKEVAVATSSYIQLDVKRRHV